MTVVGDVVDLRETLSWFETKPLFGWRVLVPRTKEQAGSLSSRLRGYGAVPEEVPTISVEPPRNPLQMDKAVRGLVEGRYEWIAFTSVNAVQAVREKFEEYGLDARAFSGLKIAAVGDKTAAAIAAWGLRADLVPSGEQSAAGLLADWPEYDELLDPINRVFLPRADIATETLVAGLIDLGWEGDDVTAYRTVRATPPPAPVRDAIKTGKFDAVVFTSSSTVRNLVGIAGKPHPSTVIAVIGPATAKTAEEHGLRVDVLAPSPSVEVLVDALADFGAARRLRRCSRPASRSPSRREPQAGRGADLALTLESTPTGAGSRSIRPRRLRRTPALRRLVAETSLEARQLVLPVFVREGLAEPRPISSMPGVVQHTRESLRKAAAEAADARARRGDALRRPRAQGRHRLRRRSTPTASSTSRSPTWSPRSATRSRVMSDLCLDEFTDHGHCGVLDRRRPGRQRRDPRGVRRDGARAGRRRRRRGRAERDDGRPGRRDPGRARRRRAHRRRDPGLLGEVRLGVLRPVPRGRRLLARRATGGPTSRTPPTRVEGVREALLDVERGRRHRDGEARAGLPRRASAGCATRSTCRSRRTTSRASTPWSRPPPPTAGSTASAAILETLTSIRRAGADIVLTYWAAEAAPARCAADARRSSARIGHRGATDLDHP